MPITHAKVLTVEDGPDTDVVRPSDWHATHVNTDAGQFAAEWYDPNGLMPGSWGEARAVFPCTITGWILTADVSGSAVVDIWKDTLANYPPTLADTITASAKPTLSSAIAANSSTLTGWTTSVAAGDILRFVLDSSATVTRLRLVVTYSRTA